MSQSQQILSPQQQPNELQGSSPSAVSGAVVPIPASHAPSAAGSVIECSDSLGGSILIRIQNMSSTADLGKRLDLKQIALRCRNTEFNPRRFAAVIMRIREPRATALIFASGKMCVTGTKSSHNSCLAVKKFAAIVEKVGYPPVPNFNFKVQNIVGTADVGFPIRLEGLVYAHSAFASYEPELFPGLIYRLAEPKVVCLIFVSGKIVITGAKTEKAISDTMTKMFPVLLEYRKQSITSIPGIPTPAVMDGNNNDNGGSGVPALSAASDVAGHSSGGNVNETSRLEMEEV